MLQLDSQVTRAEVGQLPWEKMDERYTVLSGEREERCGHGGLIQTVRRLLALVPAYNESDGSHHTHPSKKKKLNK